MVFRYMERLHISYAEAVNTPFEEVERAFLVWSLDAERDKLESERQKFKSK